MKKILFAVLMAGITVASTVAQAELKPTDDWSTILKQGHMIYIAQPKGASVFGTAGLFNACVEGNQFRSLEKQNICVHAIEQSGGQEGSGSATCVSSILEYVYMPMVETTSVCEKSVYTGKGQEDGGSDTTCVQWNTQSAQLTNKVALSVSKLTWSKEGFSTKFLFKKDLVVSNCK